MVGLQSATLWIGCQAAVTRLRNTSTACSRVLASRGERLRGVEHFGCSTVGFIDRLGDDDHVAGEFAGAEGGLLHAVGDHLGGAGLLVDRARDRGGEAIDVAHHAADRANGLDRIAGRMLDRADLLGDVLGRARGLARQRLHFGRHHREAAAGLARAGCLDGGVERQQIGLFGDVADQHDDVADAVGAGRQLTDQTVGRARDLGGAVNDAVRLRRLLVDLTDGIAEFVGGAGHQSGRSWRSPRRMRKRRGPAASASWATADKVRAVASMRDTLSETARMTPVIVPRKSPMIWLMAAGVLVLGRLGGALAVPHSCGARSRRRGTLQASAPSRRSRRGRRWLAPRDRRRRRKACAWRRRWR